jgi:carboxylesterase
MGIGRAVVLHGFGGTPASVAPLVDALGASGFEVQAPCLPGHGTTPADLASVTWEELTAAVAGVVADGVVVVGQSLGGALACWAATRYDLAGVAVANPLVAPDAELVDYLGMLLDAGETMLPAGEPDLADPEAHEEAYAELPIATLRSVQQGIVTLQPDLARVTCPFLVATSRHDHVVDPAASDHLAATVGGSVERLTLARSFHVAALDLDRELLAAAVVAFAQRVVDPDARAGGGSGR